MNTLPSEKEMYRALVQKDISYEGIFFVGVKTTGIFCRPTCTAKKPQQSNVEYFKNTSEALNAGYRPCRRCNPMEPAGSTPKNINELLKLVESDPSKKWKDYELRKNGFDPAAVRRWFQKHHRITFQSYLRSRRLALAIGSIKQGDNITQTAFEIGFESLSGFRDAFKKITGTTPAESKNVEVVYLNRILTPLGPMLAGAINNKICLLEFVDRKMLETQLKRITKYFNCTFLPGSVPVIEKLQEEMNAYFEGRLKTFSVPVSYPGTEFQKRVWNVLLDLPYGETRSYEKQAELIGNPTAVRAVASANGNNRISILIPCHRVVGKNGELCGYGGGLWRKKYLLDLEKKYK